MAELPEWLRENYEGLVASGASRWDVIAQEAEQSDCPDLAAYAAGRARQEADAAAPTDAKPARAKRTTGGE